MVTKSKSEEGGAVKEAHPSERTNYRSLLLANPNYFGTLKGSALKAVKSMAGDKTYEELKCVGYNHIENLLKAVVWVKLDSGYSGGLCAGGSKEYVRFYMSFDNGATWTDQGIVSFAAYDLPGKKPLEYAVTLEPKRYWTWCPKESLPKVRAILSWNVPPPANSPDWPPVWGNVAEAYIQIRPRKLFVLADLFKEANLTLPKEYASVLDLNQEVTSPTAKSLSAAELGALYKDKGVQTHRYLFPQIQKYIANPGLEEAYKAYGSKGMLADLGIDIAAVIKAIGNTDGDQNYEQLYCVGLDPNNQENLVGILKIKKGFGYSGPQCSAGSKEYVAFWVDWEDGAGWQWVGTTQINVHDFSTIPSDGLAYAVSQPINLAPRRKPCQKGEVTAKVRAILSWNTVPPSWNPDYKPTWGNHVDTRIHIYPGPTVLEGDYTPYLEGVCSVAPCDINQTTGFAPGDRPFGGSISIFGSIPGAPDRATPEANRPRYRIRVSQGASIEYLTNSIPHLTLRERIGLGLPTDTPFTQTATSDYYTYQDAPPTSNGWRILLPPHLLAVWNTSGKTGLWEIQLEALDPVTNTTYVAGTVLCTVDGSTRQNVIIKLDNVGPTASLTITQVSHDGGATWGTAGDCGTFVVGDWIKGTYSVSDQHFGSLTLSLQPAGHAHGAHTVPQTKGYNGLNTLGESGEWILNTTGMDACGYTIQLLSNDRTILSCSGMWHNNNNYVGFCLKAK